MGSRCCSCSDAAADFLEDEQIVMGRRKKDADEFTVVVDRSTGDGLGIDASPEKDGTLEVRSIIPGGLVDKWNQNSKSVGGDQVLPGMRVVEVNGRYNSAMQLIAMCRERDVLHITLRRTPPQQEAAWA